MQTLVLVGSGEFTDSMIGIDTYLLSLVKNKTVAILPTAAGLEKDYDKWIKSGESHFRKLGARVFGLHVVKPFDAERKEILTDIEKASFIYFSGGEPSYLHVVLDGTRLWKKILSLYENGQILAGSSAGAVVMGSHTLENAQGVFFQNAPAVWKKAFGLIDFAVFPHFDFARKEKADVIEKVMQKAPKSVQDKWIGIDEDTALIIRGRENASVMGKGNVHIFKNGKENIYISGESFIL